MLNPTLVYCDLVMETVTRLDLVKETVTRLECTLLVFTLSSALAIETP